jgi:molecular chaperone HtpG
MNETHSFQVDLRGVVDLLSHHLYASPRVYVRELLQNAVDAITQRRSIQADAPARVTITTGSAIEVIDTGIGLTEVEVHQLLATIGRSSKRDDLGFARHEFLGQFGIGLLSCFMVADEITVVTRRGVAPTVKWVGYSDGRYAVSLPAEQRVDSGTTVTLVPRRGSHEFTGGPIVAELARTYGSLLPVEITVDDALITAGEPPWLATTDKRRALTTYALDLLGLVPFDTIELSVPEAGLTGVAYVLPVPTSPAARAGHRVYLKRMLLTESAEGLLPEWAFFARCVVDASELRPTASREALYDDGLLESVRESLGAQLKGWLVRLAQTDPRRLAEFLGIHHLGVKSLALHDDELLRLVDAWWPMETNMGRMTLADFRAQYGPIHYCATTDQFRQLAAVAAAQHIAVVNAGYTYDAEIIERLAGLDPSIVVQRLDPQSLTTHFEELDPDVQLRLLPFLNAGQKAVEATGCEVLLRGFEPSTLPAMYLIDRETAFRGELRATRERVDPLWADVLGALDSAAADTRPQLVLNYHNPLVRRITVLPTDELIALAVQTLYGQSLMLGYHPIRPADAALLNRSFLALLDRAVPDGDA